MKKKIITAVLSTACLLLSLTPNMLFSANAQTGKTDTVGNKQQAMLNRERNLAIYKGIETGDMSVMDQYVAADIVDHAGIEDIKGLENVKKMLADIHNHFTNLKFTLISDATSLDGVYHYTMVRMTGIAKDDSMGMPANTPMDRIGVDVVRLQNGKAVEHWGFDDSRELMKMMGGMKKMEGMKKMDKTKKKGEYR